MEDELREFARAQTDREVDAAFTRLVTVLHFPLRNFLRGYFREDADLEDAIQQVFVKLLGVRETFLGRRDMKTWCFTIAKNKALNIIRAKSRRPDGSAVEFGQEHELALILAKDFGMSPDDEALIRVMEEALVTLRPRCKQLLQLSAERQSARQMAATTGLTEKSVATQLTRCRAALRRAIAKAGGGNLG